MLYSDRCRWKIVLVLVISVFVFIVHVFCACESAHAESVEIPKGIRDRLKRNAADLDPISFEWTIQRRSSSGVDKLANVLGTPQDYGILERRSCVFKWQDSRGYFSDLSRDTISAHSENSTRWSLIGDRTVEKISSIQERSFNGDVFCGGFSVEREDAVPGLGIYPLSHYQDNPLKNTFYQRYTIRIGYKFPSIGRELGSLGQSYVLFLAKTGTLLEASEVTEGNNKKLFCVACRGYDPWEQRDRNVTFWLDPDYGYAVVRSEIRSVDGKLAYSIKNEEFEKLPNRGVYLPKKTVVQYFTDSTIPDKISATHLFTEEFSLTKVSTDKIDDKHFDLRTKYTAPGTHIGDRALKDTDDGVQYRIPANPADLDRVIEAAMSGEAFIPTPLPTTVAIIFRWGLISVGLLMIFYALFRIFMRSK